MTTHYLPAYGPSPDRWGRSTAVCGARILEPDHSTEPSCPACAAWLVEDAEGLNTLAGLQGPQEDPLYQPVAAPDYGDITSGHARRRR